jgi:dipeptidyl aminopeptidase/acylaminoacyl peptidase
MEHQRLAIIATLLLTASLCSAQKQIFSSDLQKYTSPDGAVVALVRSAKTLEATDESRVELRTKSGKLLAKRDYSSWDGEHGYGVTKATWTPDSQFFVYSLESSGGHSAWHSPVQFFSRRENKFASLDDALHDAVMNPQFSVSAPDLVTVELWFSRETKTVSLNRVRRR